MKLLKSIILLFAITIFTSCGDDEVVPPSFPFNTENITATYKMKALKATDKESVITSGQTVDVSTTTTTGDTFQVNLILLADKTFTVKGEYRHVSTVTLNNGSAPKQETGITTVDDNGTYSLNLTDNEIIFNNNGSSRFEGTYKIDSFGQNSLVISQKQEEVDGQLKSTFEVSISFDRN